MFKIVYIVEGSVFILYVVDGVIMCFFVVFIFDFDIFYVEFFYVERDGSRRCFSYEFVSGDYVFFCGVEFCIICFN